ncbi:MAG: hypothetical protein WCS70_12140 [Verrucomicrobiota bacterium]
MKYQKTILLTSAVAATLAISVIAGGLISQKTFRTPTTMTGVFQAEGLNGEPVIGFETLIGRDLVNLALGTPLGTARSNEVLALEIDCGQTGARLVVHDKLGDSNLVVIATATSLDVVGEKSNPATPFPNRARFVAHFEIQGLGDELNGLTGGYLTLAGRILTDPQTGCPEARLVDKDKFDKICGDRELKKSEDPDELVLRAGLGHYVGVLKINSNGAAKTVLVPYGVISIRRQLLP